jgi:hypothetical protein
MSDPLLIPAIGLPAYRALHSFFLDALMVYREKVRTDVIRALDGVRFDLFLLRLCDPDDRRLRIRVKPEDDDVWIGLDGLVEGEWLILLEVNARSLGVSPDTVLKDQSQRMDAALEEIIGGPL